MGSSEIWGIDATSIQISEKLRLTLTGAAFFNIRADLTFVLGHCSLRDNLFISHLVHTFPSSRLTC